MTTPAYTRDELKKNKFFQINLLSSYARKQLEMYLPSDMPQKDLSEVPQSEYVYFLEKAMTDFQQDKIEFDLDKND